MYITNIWGITYCIIFPILILMILVFLEGVEEGKKINSKNRRNKKYE